MDWDIKLAIWEEYYLRETQIDRIRDKVARRFSGIRAPTWYTVKRVLGEFETLSPAQVGELPGALQQRWRELYSQGDQQEERQEAKESDLSDLLREWARRSAGVAQETGSRLLSVMGQNLAAQLDTLTQRVFGSFGCYDIQLKAVRDSLSQVLGQQFDAWLADELENVESSLLQRQTIQQEILAAAKSACETLGAESVYNNFSLAAYHFFARGDETWLADDHFQMVEMGTVESPSRHLECPLSPYYSLELQRWDRRDFVCPVHELPLIEERREISPSTPAHDIPATQTWPYQEQLVGIEDVARAYPSKACLSLRIPRLLPFSEIVIATSDVPAMDELKCALRDFLQDASGLREKTWTNEANLKRSWGRLLESLRSAPPFHPD
ncbi:MAG: hypothetical protein ACOC6S_02985 [Chloroflexota bacterium]